MSTRPAGVEAGAARGDPPPPRRLALPGVIVLACAMTMIARSAAAPPGIVDIKTHLPEARNDAAATGVVLTSRGEVLTNNHVIRDATTLSVTDLANGQRYAATVVGYDVSADIAVVQLRNASGLATIRLGDSATARVGESVTGYGNADGAGGTPTAAVGTIVALRRAVTVYAHDGGTRRLGGLLEVDAPILPGDSGGPLVDPAGRTIGIDTAASLYFEFVFTETAHRGYAVPIDEAIAIASQIESGRSSPSVHIGATAFLGLSVRASSAVGGLTRGVTVVSVARGSPAARAGLQAGDLLTSLDGTQVAAPAALAALLLGQHPGRTLRLGWTDLAGASRTASVVAASGPAQ